jgi:hypothetical protein
VADAERTLSELECLFKLVQDSFSRRFEDERESSLREPLPVASAALDRAIESASDTKDLPAWAMEAALGMAKQTIEEWRSRMVGVPIKDFRDVFSQPSKRGSETLSD